MKRKDNSYDRVKVYYRRGATKGGEGSQRQAGERETSVREVGSINVIESSVPPKEERPSGSNFSGRIVDAGDREIRELHGDVPGNEITPETLTKYIEDFDREAAEALIKARALIQEITGTVLPVPTGLLGNTRGLEKS